MNNLIRAKGLKFVLCTDGLLYSNPDFFTSTLKHDDRESTDKSKDKRIGIISGVISH